MMIMTARIAWILYILSPVQVSDSRSIGALFTNIDNQHLCL